MIVVKFWCILGAQKPFTSHRLILGSHGSLHYSSTAVSL